MPLMILSNADLSTVVIAKYSMQLCYLVNVKNEYVKMGWVMLLSRYDFINGGSIHCILKWADYEILNTRHCFYVRVHSFSP